MSSPRQSKRPLGGLLLGGELRSENTGAGGGLRRTTAESREVHDAAEGQERGSRIHTRLTRNGTHMGLVAMFAVLGGSLREFNLLVILAGMVTGLLIVQWRFCRAMLPGLGVRCTVPPQAFASGPFRVRFAVTNYRRWLPAWAIRLEHAIAEQNDPKSTKRAACGLALLRPGSTAVTFYDCTIRDRGVYDFGPLRLASGFPFGLVDAFRNLADATTLVVYPALVPLMPNWLGLVRNRRDGGGATRQTSGPNEGEFFGIRQWQTGDSQRWIHWRTSARIGRLAVRQFEQQHRTELSLLLDPFQSQQSEQADLEWAIRVTASIIAQLSAVPANRLALGIADSAAQTLAPTRSNDFCRSALTMLASVQPASNPRLSAALSGMLTEENRRWPILVISPRARRLDLFAHADRTAAGAVPRRPTPLPHSVLRKLDLTWLDVTSTAGQKIACREGSNR